MSSVPLQVTFRDMDPSFAVESAVQERVDKLSQYGRILRCRVMIECPHKHRRNGAHYHVRIDLTVPGNELVVAHQGTGDSAHQDLYVTIRDAFRAARRELQSFGDKQRGHVKRHSA